MGPRILFLTMAAGALAGCASLSEPVLDADGCRPAMALYQPGVGPGGAGQVIHVPRSCPPRIGGLTPEQAVMLASLEGARDAARARAGQDAPIPPRREPPPPVDPITAIRNGVSGLCGWYLGDAPYSLEGLIEVAYQAGYGRGSGTQFAPLPEMLREPSFSAWSYTAVIADPPSDGHGVAAFISFRHPTCQIQVYGYGAEADAVLAELETQGWRRRGEPVAGEHIIAQRYAKGEGAGSLTLVANRPARPEPEMTLKVILNVVPGADSDRGVLE